jgi:hypothetical protein
MILGNFRHQTLEEIFTRKKDNLFSKIYNHHEKGTCGESDLLCSNCDQLKLSGEVVIYNNRIEDKDDRVKRVTTNLKDIK